MQYNFELDKNSKLIINRLNEKGFKAYAVGGFVRDSLLGLDTSDIDIATDARPDDIFREFDDFTTVDVGAKFGTVVVVIDKKSYEVTTFRLDGKYVDGRRPETVSFSSSLSEDLKRRDFTVNAMAFHPDEGIIDLFDGQKDLSAGLIRAVGNPNQRFEEDYLRMIRAIRFACRLDFEIDQDTFEAIRIRADKIKFVSAERISVELNKILMSNYPVKGIKLLFESGLLKYIIEDLHKAVGFDQETIHHQYDVFDHTMEVLAQTPKDLDVRLAAIFHDLGKLYTKFIGEDGQGHFYGHDKVSEEIARKYLSSLRYEKKTIDTVSVLVKRHMESMNTYTEKSVRRLIRKIGLDNAKKLFHLQRADVLATNNPQFVDNIVNARALLDKIVEEDKVVFRDQLAINGHDILQIGYKPSKEVGLILETITELVADGELENEKERIISYIKERSYKDEENNNIRYMFGT